MKFDNDIIDILKNFATLNPSILVKDGNKLETLSMSKSILAEAKVSIVFDTRFAIYDLNRFIQTLKLFKDPELKFEDKYVIIKEDNNSVKYLYAEEKTMQKIKVPDKKPELESVDVEFSITSKNLKDIEKAINVLSLPNFVFEGDGNNIYMKAENVQNPTTDNYSIVVGETDKFFKGIFDSNAIKILNDDYTIQICNKGISKFIGNKVNYIIVFDYKSKF